MTEQDTQINSSFSPIYLIARYLFFFFWMVLLPCTGAYVLVILLSPGPEDFEPNPVLAFIGEQRIPCGIIFFTLIAMFFWNNRYRLPLSQFAKSKPSWPIQLQTQFEQAQTLTLEMKRILSKRKMMLSKSDLEHSSKVLEELQSQMSSNQAEETNLNKAMVQAQRLLEKQLLPWKKSIFREYTESFGLAVFVAIILKVFVLQAFKIPSGSMIPTLMIGDHIFVNKFAYGLEIPFLNKRLFTKLPPSRSDVIVFQFPENLKEDYIKRTIAIPGDTLEIINGRPILNGWLVPHCYVGSIFADGGEREAYVEFLGERSYLTLYHEKTDEMACKNDAECPAHLSCHANLCGNFQGPYSVQPEEFWVMGDNRNNSKDSRAWRNGLGAGVPYQNIRGRAMFVWMSTGEAITDRLFVNILGTPTIPSTQRNSLEAPLQACINSRPAQTTPPPFKP